ncbi:MAG: hypothetical protein U0939_24020 [Pirellulales bacterium]
MTPSNGLMPFLSTPAAQAVIWGTVLMVLLAAAGWVVLKFRGRATEDTAPASDMLSNFREMHHGGHLDESEFRTIKTMLGGKLQHELERGGTKRPAPPAEPS